MKPHDPIVFMAQGQKEVLIREMDDSYIFGGDMKENPHTGGVGCCTADCSIAPKTAIPNFVFESFHREAMRRYGQSIILAWNSDQVVGFVNFYPLNGSFDVFCPHDDPIEGHKRLEQFQWAEKPSPTLRIVCVDVAPGFRRMGLGTKLVEALIRWAPSWGFQKLHVRANEKNWWTPCKPFWDKLGFDVVETIEFDQPMADGEVRIYVMERELM